MRLILAAFIGETREASNNLGVSRAKEEWFSLRRSWLILLALAIQIVVVRTVTDPEALGLKRAAMAATAVMLVAAMLPNLRWWAFRIFAIGFVLNTLAMAVNGGLMPVTLENHLRVADADHGMRKRTSVAKATAFAGPNSRA